MSSGKKKKQKKKTICNDNCKITIWALVKMVTTDIRFIILRNVYTDVRKDTW